MKKEIKVYYKTIQLDKGFSCCSFVTSEFEALKIIHDMETKRFIDLGGIYIPTTSIDTYSIYDTQKNTTDLTLKKHSNE